MKNELHLYAGDLRFYHFEFSGDYDMGCVIVAANDESEAIELFRERVENFEYDQEELDEILDTYELREIPCKEGVLYARSGQY